jgi:hypothetical protein
MSRPIPLPIWDRRADRPIDEWMDDHALRLGISAVSLSLRSARSRLGESFRSIRLRSPFAVEKKSQHSASEVQPSWSLARLARGALVTICSGARKTVLKQS